METNKEKMIALMKACLNNRKFYDPFFQEKGDEKVNIEATSLNPLCLETIGIRETHTIWNGYVSEGEIEALGFPKTTYTYSTKNYPSVISIRFEESPPLSLCLETESKEEIIQTYSITEILKKPKGFWAMFKKAPTKERNFVLLKQINKHSFILTHGSIVEKLTLEEGGELGEIYRIMKQKIQSSIEAEKLEKRIKKYVK